MISSRSSGITRSTSAFIIGVSNRLYVCGSPILDLIGKAVVSWFYVDMIIVLMHNPTTGTLLNVCKSLRGVYTVPRTRRFHDRVKLDVFDLMFSPKCGC